MAEGDALPKQSQFYQPFGPRPGDINKGSITKNGFLTQQPDGLYTLRRSGLVRSVDASAQGVRANGLITYADNQAWILTVTNAFTLYWANSGGVSNGTELGIVVNKTDALLNIPVGFPTAFGVLVAGKNGMAGVQQSGTNLIFTPVVGPPTFMCPGLAFLDGTCYVMSAADSQIHGSVLQDPTTWPALNVVGAASSWGQGISVRRHLNYVLGFFAEGLQVYYNAGLAPPGSPLAPLPNASFLIGCQAATSIASISNMTIFAGRSASGNISIYKIAGLSVDPISPPALDQILKANVSKFQDCVTIGTGPQAVYPPVMAFAFEDKGHSFYCIKIEGVVSAICDINSGNWQIFTSVSGGVELLTWRPDYSQRGWVATDNTTLEKITPTAYTDTAGVIKFLARTAEEDFGSAYKKFVQKISFWGDDQNAQMTVRYTNDDYQTYSTAFNLSLATERKMMNRCGSFYRRAWEFTYEDVFQPFRMKTYEILIRGGST